MHVLRKLVLLHSLHNHDGRHIRCDALFSPPWRRSVSHRSPPQSKLDGVHVGDGAPHLGDQTLLGDVDVAQVEGVVDGLHLPHLDEPHSDRLGGGLKDPLPVILGLVQHLW